MKYNTILYRYIFRQMVPPFAVNLLFFSFVFLMAKILEITNLIVNYQVRMMSVLLMLMYSMPYFLEFVVPMSVMMGVLLAFLRMSGDNEIIALKSGGVSVYQMMPPVIVFCLAGCILTAFIAIYALPAGSQSFKQLAADVASSNMDIGLKERTFNNRFKNVMLYVNEISMKDKLLKDVFIEDQRTRGSTVIIVAPEGRLVSGANPGIWHLRLIGGAINQVGYQTRTANSIYFDQYDLRLDVNRAAAAALRQNRKARELELAELRQVLNTPQLKDSRYYLALIEFYKKFSISVACLALGILAIPLGVRARSRKRSFGVFLGLLFFLLYYLMLAAGKVFGEVGAYPPVIGMWVPNIVVGGLGIYLLIRTAGERPLIPDFMLGGIRRMAAGCFRKSSGGRD